MPNNPYEKPNQDKRKLFLGGYKANYLPTAPQQNPNALKNYINQTRQRMGTPRPPQRFK